MSNPLTKLRTHLTDMSTEDLLQQIADIRGDRKITKAPPKTVRKRAKRKSNAVNLLDSLSAEERAAMLAEFGG
jgi:hypothetical protein|tara:strand:+ start:6179 stop:6397 length:219 start_codon:yes stop_codon:yes gene_type:complete